jgi:peptide deformylase
MSVKTVLRLGEPALLDSCENVSKFDTPELHQIIQDMLDTMKAENGAGLAAIQIGIHLNIVVFGFEENSRYPDEKPIPETILINPVIEPLGNEMEDAWEGCLSVPGMRGLVPRYKKIRYTGFDQYGNRIDRTVEGFHARVVQHECDHLKGILYVHRIKDMNNYGFTEELQNAGKLNTPLPCETACE